MAGKSTQNQDSFKIEALNLSRKAKEALMRNQPKDAERFYKTCIEILHEQGDHQWAEANIHVNLAELALQQGNIKISKLCIEQSLTMRREILGPNVDNFAIVEALMKKATLARVEGNIRGECSYALESVAMNRRLFHRSNRDLEAAYDLKGAGDAAKEEGSSERALKLYTECNREVKRLVAAELFMWIV